MQTISDIVENIFHKDFEAQSAARNNYLDISNYARQIQKEVNEKTLKNINLSTLAITIKRIIERRVGLLDGKNSIRLSNVFIYSDLVEHTFEKNRHNLALVSVLTKDIEINPDKFFTMTQSNHELTIITEKDISIKVEEVFHSIKPLFKEIDLCGISVKFSIRYLNEPNVIFEITRRLANKNINIIEIVSTTTELTFIIKKSDADSVILEMTNLL